MSINHTPFNYSDYELTIYVDDPELFDKYTVAAEKHLQNIMKPYFDSGFDMYVPETIISKPGQVVKIVSNIVCDMQNMKRGQRASRDRISPSGFYVYPRSSISKTPLRLANQVGIIDSGYRGPLIGVFDNISNCPIDPNNTSEHMYKIEKHTRLLQICTPDLSKFKVIVNKVDDITELAKQTDRGAGGFGSTGTK